MSKESEVLSSPPVADREPRARSRSWLIKPILFLVSLLLAFGVSEATLRLLGYGPLWPDYGDPLLGIGSYHNRTFTYLFPEYGGKLTLRTNSRGFNEDRPTNLEKTPGVRRVAVVGDSQTACQCTNPESYSHILEAALNERSGGSKFEVINAGVGKYSPYQYYVKTVHEIVPLKPDNLVVSIYLGNDYMDLIRHDDRPYLTVSPGGEITAHRPEFVVTSDPSKPRTLFQKSSLITRVEAMFGSTIMYQLRRADMLWRNATDVNAGVGDVVGYMYDVKRLTDISVGFMTQSLSQYVWFKRFPATFETASTLNRHVVHLFRDLASANGIQLTYVLIPSKLRIEPDDMKPVLERVQRFDPGLTESTLMAAEDKIAEDVIRACAAEGVPVIDLRKPLLAERAGGRLYYPEEMHLNPAGNRLIGKVLSWSLPLEPNN